MLKIAIIGSGLASISAAKVLIDRGIRPTIIDCGDSLDVDRKKMVEKLSLLEPKSWNKKDLSLISANPTIHNKGEIPQKLAFGSDYFYGRVDRYQQVEFDECIPPFSYAKGGFSVGWGAAVLPPDENDLTSWPIGNKDLGHYYEMVLKGIPYSASNDALSSIFPLYSKSMSALELTAGNKEILKDLTNSVNTGKQKDVVAGQSRLLVQSSKSSADNGCKYCGQCLSGCVYGYIYKASNELDRLISLDKVDYISNSLVHSLSEEGNMVKIFLENTENKLEEELFFDKVLLGAGAVNSTRIVLKSKKIYNKDVRLLSTVTFIAPVFRFKKIKIDWPKVNTQPGIFLEYKNGMQSNQWVHTQLSTPNELILDKLRVDFNKKGIIQWAKKKLVEHLVVAHGNIHSDDAGGYILSLRKAKEGDILHSKREKKISANIAVNKSVLRLFNILRKIGCIVLLPLVKNSIKSGSFHVGGTMPMMNNPINDTDTDILGTPKGWRNIHVIDSSVFPSLPGTTIGLLAMANAARIASKIEINQ